ncbi:Cof-type HAD-IIB family hydrolase [Enterococcus hermanniensis]|uniref:Cof-like hydrolase n=1 Tax=Enterococcus hermanniensis TaxID=249189 RepID=A0A1L8TMQ4_9ENTE|nr:Cof-type HAD-IIB family hydrolase [Enterococcus hermanniensis]OJG45567.1 cof-like hydrolase [Enterococcus hermanniensis]
MIQAIAVDMDGTFLKSDNTYDVSRFKQIFEQLEKRDIHFVVASGNQYYQLKSFFPTHQDQITFVSENGALVFESDRLLRSNQFSTEVVQRMLTFLANHDLDLNVIVCGIASAYILKTTPKDIYDIAKIYYHRLETLDSFDHLPTDPIVKFALNLPIEKVADFVIEINAAFQGEVKAVASGHGSVDIIIPGMNKGRALEWLLDRWNLQPDQLIAFGDANNDLEMLALTQNSYAMESSSPALIKTAKHRAPSNNASGVLEILEKRLATK